MLAEVVLMKREGVYVCMGAIMKRMPDAHQDILWNTLWALAREGKLA